MLRAAACTALLALAVRVHGWFTAVHNASCFPPADLLIPFSPAGQAAPTARAAAPAPWAVQWATGYGDTAGSGQSIAQTIAVDRVTGVSYIGGWCRGTLPISTLPPITCQGTADMLLAKWGLMERP